MPAPTTLLLFALATFLLTVTPGPGVLYVTARSVSQGRRAGFASMFGIEAGEVAWIIAAATGVAAVLSASTQALDILRFGGAGYLVYLGIQRWREVERPATPEPARLSRVFIQGVVTQLVNPKVAVFFVAFLPQFLNPTCWPPRRYPRGSCGARRHSAVREGSRPAPTWLLVWPPRRAGSKDREDAAHSQRANAVDEGRGHHALLHRRARAGLLAGYRGA